MQKISVLADSMAQDSTQRVINQDKVFLDDKHENSLRPTSWENYIGQDKIKRNLHIFIQASKKRGECLDHILFFGPPGLGKTTLSHIIAYEMGANIKVSAAPMIEKAGDLAAIMTNLNKGDILFIDEIHRLSPAIEEILYPAMEDFRLDIIIGQGAAAQTVKIDLEPFTLIGATTRAGMLSNPLRERFGISAKLEFYSESDLSLIIQKASQKLHHTITPTSAAEIARRSRGTPRIALRLLRRVRDFAQVQDMEIIDETKQDLPNATTVQVVGILALVLFWVYGIVGLVLGIIAWIMGNTQRNLYYSAPGMYSEGSLSRVNVGRTCGIIAVCLSVLVVLFVLLFMGLLVTAVFAGAASTLCAAVHLL